MIKYDFRKFNERPIMGFIDILDINKPEFDNAERDLNHIVFFKGDKEVFRVNDNGFLHNLIDDIKINKED